MGIPWFAFLLVACPYAVLGLSTVVVDSCDGTGMVMTITLDLTTQLAGLDYYFPLCVGAETDPKSSAVDLGGDAWQVTVGMAAMQAAECGTYGIVGTDPVYSTTLIIPYNSFLVTDKDMKLDVQCSFNTIYAATLAPTVATQINTLAPTASVAGGTTNPVLIGAIKDNALAPLFFMIVGQEVICHIEFHANNGDQDGYWKYILVDKLTAYATDDILTAQSVPLVEESCPAFPYSLYLEITYTASVETDNVDAQIGFRAFRFKDTAAADVYFEALVTVCAATATPGICAKTCPARKKRALFHDAVLGQSLREDIHLRVNRAALNPDEELADFLEPIEGEIIIPVDPTKDDGTVHKTIKLKMIVRDADSTPSIPNLPGVVEVDGNKLCIPRGTGVAVLVSLLVLALFVATMSILCFCVVKRRKHKGKSNGYLTSPYKSSVGSSSVVSVLTPRSGSMDEDYVLHNNNYKAPLIDNDHLSVYAGSTTTTTSAGDLSCQAPCYDGHHHRQQGPSVADLAQEAAALQRHALMRNARLPVVDE